MPEIKRTLRVTTTQHVLKDIAPVEEGFPMRKWSISITLLNDQGKEVPATVFDKVTYYLHPTFANPVRAFKKAPFRIEEEGWGGFDMTIAYSFIEKGGEKKIKHDLNFNKEKYVIDHPIAINTTKPNILKELTKSGPVPGYNPDGTEDLTSSSNKRKNGNLSSSQSSNIADSKTVKKIKSSASKGGVDLEKLADGLTKLNEDDLLVVVQMVNDNKTSDMSIKNDVDNGEFTMDLYTLPDTLLKSLFDYITKRIE